MAPEIKAALRGSLSFIFTGALLFLIAGSLDYWQGWITLGVMGAGALLSATVLLRDRELLKRRSNIRERSKGHMAVQLIAIAAMLFAAIFPPFDHRFGWSHVPVAVCIAGQLITLLAFINQYLVLRENRFASARIEIAEDQRVISTGPYAYIRHPWYVGLLLVFLGLPLGLGSYWGLLALPPMFATLAWRIFSEERYLKEHLLGYSAYLERVRWRLLPGVF